MTEWTFKTSEQEAEKTWVMWELSQSDIELVWKEKCEQTRKLTDEEIERIAHRFGKGFYYTDWEWILQDAIEYEIPECKK